tara:strand:- start:179 stop:367 length:189 start_codon:yes stop_codon:yes gene_type:complete
MFVSVPSSRRPFASASCFHGPPTLLRVQTQLKSLPLPPPQGGLSFRPVRNEGTPGGVRADNE